MPTKIQFELELHLGRTWPDYQFNFPASISSVDITDSSRLHTVVIENIDSAVILYLYKGENETVVADGKIIRDQKIKIKKVYVDDILLESNILEFNSLFIPQYNQSFINYCKDNNLKVDHSPVHSLDFYHSGQWILDFGSNFWTWYQKCRLDTAIKYMPAEQVDAFIGLFDSQTTVMLQNLKQKLCSKTLL